MTAPRKLRVALGPTEIAGYYANLAAGLEELGAECAMLMVTPHSFRYGSKPPAGRIARLALQQAQASYPGNHSGVARLRVLPVNLFWRSVLVAHALRSYDVFIFSCGDTLLNQQEIPLLKLLGKKLVFVFHGSDSRPPYLNGKHVQRAGHDLGGKLARQALRTKRRLARVHRYADAIVDSPLSGHFHERSFINWFRIGIPYKAPEAPPATAASDGDGSSNRPLRVVHAPSDPGTKGSVLIEQAIERARARGIRIDFIQLKGRPNAEVLAELARCDFVVDELYSDVPGAGLAYEAAAFGRPTIVAGYAAPEFARWIEPGMALPTHYCRPEELDKAIDTLALDAEYRGDLGARARRFIQDKCAPTMVAQRLLRVLEGRDLDGWHVDPSEITYVFGTGLTEETARNAVRAVIGAASERGLQLPDKSEFVRRLKAFAFGQLPTP